MVDTHGKMPTPLRVVTLSRRGRIEVKIRYTVMPGVNLWKAKLACLQQTRVIKMLEKL